MNPIFKKSGHSIRVSLETFKKLNRIEKYTRLSSAHRFWAKDQILLKSNILLVPDSVNYKVLLAMKKKEVL